MKNLKICLLGIIGGIICGMFSAGGGLIILPSLIHIFKIDEKKARATTIFSLLFMVATARFFLL